MRNKGPRLDVWAERVSNCLLSSVDLSYECKNTKIFECSQILEQLFDVLLL